MICSLLCARIILGKDFILKLRLYQIALLGIVDGAFTYFCISQIISRM